MTLNDLEEPFCVTVFQVESLGVDALVLRHDCFKIDGDEHTVLSLMQNLDHKQ